MKCIWDLARSGSRLDLLIRRPTVRHIPYLKSLFVIMIQVGSEVSPALDRGKLSATVGRRTSVIPNSRNELNLKVSRMENDLTNFR